MVPPALPQRSGGYSPRTQKLPLATPSQQGKAMFASDLYSIGSHEISLHSLVICAGSSLCSLIFEKAVFYLFIYLSLIISRIFLFAPF